MVSLISSVHTDPATDGPQYSCSANIAERHSKIASIGKNCPEFELATRFNCIGPRKVRMRNASGHSWFIR